MTYKEATKKAKGIIAIQYLREKEVGASDKDALAYALAYTSGSLQNTNPFISEILDSCYDCLTGKLGLRTPENERRGGKV